MVGNGIGGSSHGRARHRKQSDKAAAGRIASLPDSKCSIDTSCIHRKTKIGIYQTIGGNPSLSTGFDIWFPARPTVNLGQLEAGVDIATTGVNTR